MGGYRLEPDDSEAGTLRLVDLATKRSVSVLNLGLAENLSPGQHLLARIVPTGPELGRMLDWRPLPVDRRTATVLGRDVDAEPDEPYDDLAQPAFAEALRLAGSSPPAVGTRLHTISELILDAALSDRVGSRFAAPEFLPAWRALSEMIDEPARSRCLEMAMWSDAALADPNRRAG